METLHYTNKKRQITFNRNILKVAIPSIERLEDGTIKPSMKEKTHIFLTNSTIEYEALKKTFLEPNSVIIEEINEEVKYSFSTADLLEIASIE